MGVHLCQSYRDGRRAHGHCTRGPHARSGLGLVFEAPGPVPNALLVCMSAIGVQHWYQLLGGCYYKNGGYIYASDALYN